MVALEIVVLKFELFPQTTSHNSTTQYHEGCMQQACEARCTLVAKQAFLDIARGVRYQACIDLF